MSRIMADTINSTVDDISKLMQHQTISLVAGYVNGHYAWSAEDWAKFPSQAHVTIDVNGSNPSADVLDVEPGDATPADAVVWVRNKLKQNPHYPPILYVNRSNMTTVIGNLSKAGYALGRDYRFWVATLDGTQGLPDMRGVTAVQYASSAMTGTNVDLSVVYDVNFKAPVSPPPVRPPVSGPTISQQDADRIAASVWYMARFMDPAVPLPTGTDVNSSIIRSSFEVIRKEIAKKEAAEEAKWLGRVNAMLAELKLPPIK